MNNFVFFLGILIIFLGYFLELIADLVDYKNIQYDVPEEFKDIYSQEKYKKSQEYKKDNIKFNIISSSFNVIILLIILSTKVLNYVNNYILSYNLSPVISGVIFIGLFVFFMDIISIPFSLYYHFKLEEKYGFNRMTLKVFFIDKLKSYLLLSLIGLPVLALILYFFTTYPDIAWLYTLIFLIIFQIFIIFIAPYIIFPLFNKFYPLDNIELKDKIVQYFRNVNINIKEVFVMDGSKRSTKSNAFFTGFGSSKRIVLYDTLMEQFTSDEIVSIIAHESGHYKKKHIFLHLVISILETALMLFLLTMFLNSQIIYEAFGIETPQIYIGFLLFGIFYSPVELIFSLFSNKLSRIFEKQADIFAIETIPDKGDFISALKKLSVGNLVNLTPHKFKVILEYSHPPMLERIEYIKKYENK